MQYTPKQLEVINMLTDHNNPVKHVLSGGAMGSGKTILLLKTFHMLCMSYPGTRYAVIRKSTSALRRNTLPSMKKILKAHDALDEAELNLTQMKYVYKNGSEILFMEADISKDPDLDKIKGLEVTAAGLDEANEVAFDVFDIMKGRVNRWYNTGDVTIKNGNKTIKIPYKIKGFILMTCNPANNWVKNEFYDRWKQGKLSPEKAFVPALPEDNPYLEQEYIDSLYTMSPELIERYVRGNWDFTDNPNQLIFLEWLMPQYFSFNPKSKTPKYIGVDYAREGNDKTTFFFADNTNLLWYEQHKYYGKEHSSILCDKLQVYQDMYCIPDSNIVVDAIGNGAALIDVGIERKKSFSIYKSSDKQDSSGRPFYFRNMRTQSYWDLREDIRKGELFLLQDFELQKQFLTGSYEIDGKAIIYQGKKEIKKLLGYSPDIFDAAVMVNWLRRRRTSLEKMSNAISGFIAKKISTLSTSNNRRRRKSIKEDNALVPAHLKMIY